MKKAYCIIFAIILMTASFSVKAEDEKTKRSTCVYENNKYTNTITIKRAFDKRYNDVYWDIKHSENKLIDLDSEIDEWFLNVDNIAFCPEYISFYLRGSTPGGRNYEVMISNGEPHGAMYTLVPNKELYSCNYKSEIGNDYFSVTFREYINWDEPEIEYEYKFNRTKKSSTTVNDYTNYFSNLDNINHKNCIPELYITDNSNFFGSQTYYSYNLYSKHPNLNNTKKYILVTPDKEENEEPEEEIKEEDLGIYEDSYFCKKSSPIWQFVGYIFTVIRIFIPLIIIGLAVYDLVKVVISSERDSLNKSIKTLIKRLILGIIIFFIPSIVNVVMYIIDPNDKYTKPIDICKDCLISPNSSNCKNVLNNIKENQNNS